MAKQKKGGLSRALEQFAHRATEWSGNSWAFLIAFGVVVVWAATGPLFNFSDSWQLVINTGTTIVTFLMVFLIQRAQNKETLALQLKLNEVVAALEGASNRLIAAEDLSEEEIRTLHQHYRRLVELSRRDADITRSHSVEEAEERHMRKHGQARGAKESPREDKRKP